MVKRIRDRIAQFRPQEVISYADWTDIMDRYNYAYEFLKENNPMSTLMRFDLEEAKTIIMENRVHEVKEVHIVSDALQKIFTTGKKEQIDELVGELKYIKGFLGELQSWVERKEKLEKLEAAGKIIIRREEPKDERS